MSISGGLHRAVERAGQVEATALQLFVKSSRQWNAKPLEDTAIRRFRGELARSGLGPFTLAHASYLINLASPDDSVWRRSIRGFRAELERCDQLSIPYLVVHPGAHVGSGERAGLSRVVRALDRVLDDGARGEVVVLLETTAGQGSNLGYRFEQLGWILDRTGSRERLGLCLDTCHVVAAGYALDSSPAFEKTLAELEHYVGLSRLKAVHLNDSKFGLGSRKDRHEHIGRGSVGLAGCRRLLSDPRTRELPMVLETPKGQDLAEDRQNLATLRGLIRRPQRTGC
jgi:deoxyribonuclease-4